MCVAYLKACGEASCALHALFTVLEVSEDLLGSVALPPGHITVGEEPTGVLINGYLELSLVAIIHLYRQ